MYDKSISSYKHFLASIILEFQFNQFVNICRIVLKMEHNGRVYETFGISKRFPVKLQ